jgi:hypothetical protein
MMYQFDQYLKFSCLLELPGAKRGYSVFGKTPAFILGERRIFIAMAP